MCRMNKPQTKSECVRLTVAHWEKLRQLMQGYGRAWLERSIDREHTKRFGPKNAADAPSGRTEA